MRMFFAFEANTAFPVRLNVNLNVTGFKIFGEFSGAYVTGTVLSPLAQNVVRASCDMARTAFQHLEMLYRCGKSCK